MDLASPPLPVLVVAVALMGQDGRVLMQRRAPDKAHGGLWEFPGGKVEPGETPEQAAAREIAEELGVAIDPGRLEPVAFASGPAQPGAARALVILLYACRDWQGEPEAREAAAAVAWYPLAEVGDLAMPPLDYPLARALCGQVGRESAPDHDIGVDRDRIPS